MSLFQGTPQTASSYVTTTSDMPKWLQDAIYSQIQNSFSFASKPYEAYTGTQVAGLNPLQQQAYQQVQEKQGAWEPALTATQQQTQQLLGQSGALSTASPFMQQAAGMDGLAAASPYLQQAMGTSGAAAANPYLQQQLSQLGQINYGAASQQLSPYAQSAASMSGARAAQPLAATSAQMAQRAAGATTDVSAYMSPYQKAVTDEIAKMGTRNLQENLLPGVSDAFVKAGQFGGTRMGEFGARALRDTQEAVLAEQSRALQAGYGQAQQAAQADAARALSAAGQVGTLAGQAGQLTQAQQQALLASGQALAGATQQGISQQLAGIGQVGQVGQTLGGLTQAQQQALLSGAGQVGQLTQAQQQVLQQLGQQAGQLRTSDLQTQQSILQQMAQQAQLGQQMQGVDTAALEAAGTAQRAVSQEQLNAQYQNWLRQQQYPYEQLNWLSAQIRGMQPYSQLMSPTMQSSQSVGQTYSQSPLSQLATAGATALGAYNLFNKV